MNYIILDLEWNQCPEGKTGEQESLPFEIIEIGAVKLDNNFQETGRFSELIKPSVYPSFHHKTKEIIGRSEEDYCAARNFPMVFKAFCDWCGADPAFCTWGPMDLLELQRNARYYLLNGPFTFPLYYYDIQKLFSIAWEDRKSRRTLEYAVDFLTLPKERPFHDAFSDALYTARILRRLPQDVVLANYSIDYFRTPRNRKEEIEVIFDTYSKFVSKEFESRSDAMRDRKTTATKCYRCGRHAKRKIRWFSAGNHNYYSVSYCEIHGWMRGKIRLKKNEAGKYFAIKILKLISEADAEKIRLRYESSKKRQAAKKGPMQK